MVTLHILQAWVFGVMTTLVPVSDWQDSYEVTSQAIAEESYENPLEGFTASETAAFLTEFGYTESRFNSEAVGDCKEGLPKTTETCQSIGLFQISKMHAPVKELLRPAFAARHARQLFEVSMHVCASRPERQMFAWYAVGGFGCNEKGFKASEWRYWNARDLLRQNPLP